MNAPLSDSRAGLVPIAAADFLFAGIMAKDGQRSIGAIAQDFSSYLAKEQVLAAYEELQRRAMVTTDNKKVVLTERGKAEAHKRFGKLRGKEGLQKLKNVVWPSLSLGMEPTSKAAARLVQGSNLRALALTAILGLPLNKEAVTLNEAVSSILVRGLAGVAATAHDYRSLEKTVRSFGDLANLDVLRRDLVRAALGLGDQARTGTEYAPTGTEDGIGEFAERVQAIANELSTPPFSHKVAISQVYDAYGRVHKDAGPLDAFKARLLVANSKGVLSLYPLDEPKSLDAETRGRSAIDTQYGRYHFVARS
ncbi:hypothetical protein JDN40_00805 [Rhodomicrobium vannielii ATCC 17100]|uniref:hypothetical protein n=1 Tax=Rhodomicrobium vannielii TaxID=1069 RepID=UPI0019184A50|nr:hypothetical protein [Rhodomicrobium vannielii]MBJ7532671.1 hypothetical protein [Rhodomicrobium vannielii ATCC 17100]